MKFARDKFFAAMRAWGILLQGQVDGLTSLLDGFESDEKMSDVRWIAYALATVKHETANTYKPIAEYGKGRGKPYGVKDPETGQTYYGRGYVQLTWRRNYEKMSELTGVDLVNEPHLAMEPETAYQIMSVGMRHGIFTGKKLFDYIHGDTCDYLHARRIINAMDKAQLIADYAERFQKILEDATEPTPVAISTEVTKTTVTETPSTTTVVEEKSALTIPSQVKEIAGTGLTTVGQKLATGGISTGLLSAVGAFVEKAWPLLIFAGVLIVLGVAVWMLIYHTKQKEKHMAAQIAADPTRTDIVFK